MKSADQLRSALILQRSWDRCTSKRLIKFEPKSHKHRGHRWQTVEFDFDCRVNTTWLPRHTTWLPSALRWYNRELEFRQHSQCWTMFADLRLAAATLQNVIARWNRTDDVMVALHADHTVPLSTTRPNRTNYTAFTCRLRASEFPLRRKSSCKSRHVTAPWWFETIKCPRFWTPKTSVYKTV